MGGSHATRESRVGRLGKRGLGISALLLSVVGIFYIAGGISAGSSSDPSPFEEVTLVPFTSQALGIQGLVPVGWIEVKPGQFLRNPGGDPTLFGQVSYPGADMEEMRSQYRLPERIGTIEAPSLTWELHRGELNIPEAGTMVIGVGLSESEFGVYLAMLVTLAEEHEALHEMVMLPAMRALAPAEGSDRQRPEGDVPMPRSQPSLPIETRRRETDDMVMVYVPSGEFEMGNEGIQWVWNGGLALGDLGLQVYTDESPPHTVYLDAFWFDQTEVTVAMFREFVAATGYQTAAERDGWGAPYRPGPEEPEWPHVTGADWMRPHGPDSIAADDHPVVQVSWDDAAAYCEWAGGALPTEAQWEKAARGLDGRAWPWGDAYDGNRGNFCDKGCPMEPWRDPRNDDGYAFTAPVGSYPDGASAYGALDMAGNVWEWVADWYAADYYEDSPYVNPLGPLSGDEHAQRGGAWIDTQSRVRATVRHATGPWVRCDDLGFRCAVPAE
jgi:formylglycine-generating enzyme required for sulfatase activity